MSNLWTPEWGTLTTGNKTSSIDFVSVLFGNERKVLDALTISLFSVD